MSFLPSLYSIPSLIGIFIILIPIFLALREWDEGFKNRLLFIFLIQVLCYMISEFIIINSAAKETALLCDRWMHTFTVLFTSTYLHISLIYPERLNIFNKNEKLRRFTEIFIYLPAVFFIILMQTKYMIADMRPEYWGWSKVEGPAFNLFRIFAVISFLTSVFIYIYKLKLFKEGKKRNQILFLFWATVPPGVLALIVASLPLYNIIEFNIIAVPLFTVYIAAVITYATLNDYIIDMQLVFAPIIKTSKYFFVKKLEETNQSIASKLSFKDIAISISDAFGCDTSLFLEKKITACVASNEDFCNMEIDKDESDKFIDSLKTCSNNRKIIIPAAEMEKTYPKLGKRLIKHGVCLIIPVSNSKDKIKGAIMLGGEFRFPLYSKKDIHLIKQLQIHLFNVTKYIMMIEQRMQEDAKYIKSLEINYEQMCMKIEGQEREKNYLLRELRQKYNIIESLNSYIEKQEIEIKKSEEKRREKTKAMYSLRKRFNRGLKKIEELEKENKRLKDNIRDLKTPVTAKDMRVDLKAKEPVKLAYVGADENFKLIPDDKRIEAAGYKSVNDALEAKPDVIAFEYTENVNDVSPLLNEDIPVIFILDDNSKQEFDLSNPPYLSDLIDINYIEQDIAESAIWLSVLKNNTLFKLEKEHFISGSFLIKNIFEKIDKALNTDSSILIHGSTGTGKDMAVQYIRKNLDIHPNRFQVFESAGMTDKIACNELFGHERGAYEGAHAKYKGILEKADQGVLYIKEIGRLSIKMQKIILDVLDGRPYRRLGGTKELTANIRVLASTNEDINRLLMQGKLSKDLYHRIAQIEIFLPPLEERPEDIGLLAQYFFLKKKLANRLYSNMSKDFAESLKNSRWAGGNVRELKNKIEEAVLDAKENGVVYERYCIDGGIKESFVYSEEVIKFKILLLKKALRLAKGVQIKAAKIANMSTSNMSKKIKKYNLYSLVQPSINLKAN